MGRVHLDLDVEDGREAAQALRADAERVDAVVDLHAELLFVGLRTAGEKVEHVEGFVERFLREKRGLFSGTADADAEDPGRAPAGAHVRNLFEHPVDDAVRRDEHGELGLVFRAAALRGDRDLDLVARDDLPMDDGGGVVLRVLAGEFRRVHRGEAQDVFGAGVGTAHAFVDGVLNRAREAFPTDVHADLHEDDGKTGVLADRTVADLAEAGVFENLADRILRGGAFLAGIGRGHVTEEVGGMVVADVLEGSGDALDEVVLLDHRGHGCFSPMGRPPQSYCEGSNQAARTVRKW